MTERTFPAITNLIQQLQQQNAQPDGLRELIAAIRKVIETHPDAHSLAGALVEGVAVTICTRVPEDQRAEVALACLQLLHDRLEAGGAI